MTFLSILLAAGMFQTVAAGSEEQIKQCGRYRLESLTVGLSKRYQSPVNIIQIYDHQDRLVKTLSHRGLQTIGQCRDITGDAVPELLVEGHTGGNFGYSVSALYSMGETIQNLLILENPTGIDFSHMKNLDEDPALEIVTYDTSLFFVGGLSAVDSPTLPLILCYGGQRYVDCTREFPGLLEQAIQSTEVELANNIKSDILSRGREFELQLQAVLIKEAILELAGLHILAGRQERSWQSLWQKLREIAPQDVVEVVREEVEKWLLEHRNEIADRLKRHGSNIHYE